MRFVRKRLYKLTINGESKIDILENLSDICGLSVSTLMTYSLKEKYKHLPITIEKTNKFLNYAYMKDEDVEPYWPSIKQKNNEKESTYFEHMIVMLKKYGNCALGINEKNPAKYLPKLYELGFDCKVNTYIEPSIRTAHKKQKEYYSLEVVKCLR